MQVEVGVPDVQSHRLEALQKMRKVIDISFIPSLNSTQYLAESSTDPRSVVFSTFIHTQPLCSSYARQSSTSEKESRTGAWSKI